jgi:hypothetical protein
LKTAHHTRNIGKQNKPIMNANATAINNLARIGPSVDAALADIAIPVRETVAQNAFDALENVLGNGFESSIGLGGVVSVAWAPMEESRLSFGEGIKGVNDSSCKWGGTTSSGGGCMNLLNHVSETGVHASNPAVQARESPLILPEDNSFIAVDSGNGPSLVLLTIKCQ